MSREIKTNVNNILSLIACSRDYGFEDDEIRDRLNDFKAKYITK
jgi:hypothetical protein